MPLPSRLRAGCAARLGATVAATVVAASVAFTIAGSTPAFAASSPTQTLQPHVAGDYVSSPAAITAAKTGGVTLRSAALPASVDLRANAPAPGNQGQLADCTAWTIGYSIMGYWANVQHTQGAPFAPLYLYLQSLAAPQTAPNGGTSGYASLTEAKANGVDTQADYVQGTTAWQTAPTTAEKAHAKAYQVSGWAHLFQGVNQGAQAQQLIEAALAAGDPVAIGFNVSENFEQLKAGQLYTTPSGANLGGHMVAAYGYTKDGVVVRNSWGASWGTGGDATLSWAFVDAYVLDAYSVSGITAPAAGAPAATTTPAAAPPASPPAVTTTVVKPAVAGIPTVTSLSVASGYTTVATKSTITGTSLGHAARVLVAGKPIAFSQRSDTSIAIVLPLHPAGVVNVQIVTDGGTSVAGPTSTFTYLRPPAPVVTKLSAVSARTSTKSTTVDLLGSFFTGATSVTLAGKAVPFSVRSDGDIRVVLPAHRSGTFAIAVRTPVGTSANTPHAAFTYRAR